MNIQESKDKYKAQNTDELISELKSIVIDDLPEKSILSDYMYYKWMVDKDRAIKSKCNITIGALMSEKGRNAPIVHLLKELQQRNIHAKFLDGKFEILNN